MDGMLYACTLRSPIAAGRIKSIHIPHLPRGYRSITVDDIPGRKTIEVFGTEIPILAGESVRYKGEPIALLVGPDRRRLQEALQLAHISLEEAAPDLNFVQFNSGRIAARREQGYGDVDLAFSIAQSIVEADYQAAPRYPACQEPQAAAAWFDYDKLRVRTSTQWPYMVRSQVAAALKVKDSEVVVEAADPGKHLDSRIWYPALVASQAAVAAVLCGRPVLLMLSHQEDFQYTCLRSPVHASYRAAIDKNGLVSAIDARIIINTGAYGVMAANLAAQALSAVTGAYAVPNLRVQCYAVRSNQVSMGPMAGLALSQTLFAIERLMDDCARQLDVDPLSFRSQNLLKRNSEGPASKRKKNIPFAELSEKVCAMSDFYRKHASFELVRKRHSDPNRHPGRGIGLALGFQPPGGFPGLQQSISCSVEVELTKDSEIIVRSSAIPGNTGTLRIWQDLAARHIGQAPGTVRFEALYTGDLPDAGPSSLSGTISIISQLIETACQDICQRRFREGLPIVSRKTWRSRLSETYGPSDACSWGSAVVELHLDPLSGNPVVPGIWLAVKAGRLLSPVKARSVLENNCALAYSQVMYEHINHENGQIAETAWQHYRLARFNEIPPIHVHLMDSDDKAPIGGLGDLPFSLIPPALISALSQARDSSWQSDYAGSLPQGGLW